jgi:hypothetical protein
MNNNSKNATYELIHSLNKSQRLLLSRKWSNPPYSHYLYVQVYQIIIAQKKYNQQEILGSIHTVKPNQLTNILKELTLKILDHLRIQQPPTPFEQYRKLLKNYSILKGLNLPIQAEKWKKKALLFKTQNTIISEAVLVDEETYYYETMSKPDTLEHYKFSNEVSPFTHSLMREYLKLREFYLIHRFSKNEQEHALLSESLNATISQIDYIYLSLYDQVVYNRMLYHFHYIQRDFVMAYKYATTLVSLYEKTGLENYYREVYLKVTNYQLLCLYRLNAGQRYKKLLQRFCAIRFQSSLPDINHLNESHFKYVLTHQLNLYIIRGDFSHGLSHFSTLENRFYSLDINHNAGYVNSIYYKVACLHFGNGDFRSSVSFLDKLIFNMDKSGRPDLQIFARILKLTSLFELQETEYIFENIRSAYSYLARNKQLNMFQIEIMRFLRKCARLPASEIRDELVKLRAALHEVAQNKFEQRPFFYFDVISWLDSKLSGRSIASIISERGLGHRILQVK